MSSVSYDLDTSGGLMPLIKALIKPPDEEGNGQKSKKPQHPYYKRPGKGHNHDSCDACGEGGDLICCDRCPASFHLGCYDPPLEENDIPAGLWLCRECRASDADQPTSSRGSRAQSPTDSKSDSEKKTRTLRNRSSSKKKSKDESEEEVEEEVKKEPEPEKELTPMEILVRAAKIMNPTQFELPREMQVPCIFPGTEKEGSKNGGPSVITTDSQGCVPLPAKTCFVCVGTCKQAPLIQCDYCPLLFHQDCLDPPLTALPTGRWMCPNHVENFIDWKLVNSISLTERAALWERFAAPLDQHAVKIDFIRRARNYGPRFRLKLAGGQRGRVAVPAAVKAHYRRPPPLLPSRREYVRCRNVLKKLQQSQAYTESSDDDGPKRQICLDLDCTEHLEEENEDKPADTAADVQDEEMKDVKSESEWSSDLSEDEYERPRRKRSAPSAPAPAPPDPRVRASALGRAALAAGAGAGAGAGALAALDDDLIRLLAAHRLAQIVEGERGGELSAAGERAVLRALPPPRRPAAPPSCLLTRADRERISRAVWGGGGGGGGGGVPRALPPPAPDSELALVRAALCPTKLRGGQWEASGRATAMRAGSLRAGAAAGCGLALGAACRRVSPAHAVIFMDEVTRHFELINYSEYGTEVNGVMYTCDVTHCPPAPSSGEGEDRAAPLRDIVRNRMPKPIRINGDLTAPTASDSCRCGPPRAGPAWEGSALLPHGALITFGCHTYVFCIIDAGRDEPPAI